MAVADSDRNSLWLAKTLWDLGAVTFGDFTIGRSTVHSPIYINPRVLISAPAVLRMVADLVQQETLSALVRKRQRVSSFDLVAGVPFGGLHLATAFALTTNIPMIYARTSPEEGGRRVIEGRYTEGSTVLIIDDLITTGGSVLETAEILESADLIVKDVVVLIDREQGAGKRLQSRGYHLTAILRLKTMLTFYFNSGLIEPLWYYRTLAYIDANQVDL